MRLEEIVQKIYGEPIGDYARGSERLKTDAINVCIPAIVALTLPEEYAAIVLTSRMDNELRKLLERTLHRQGNPGDLLFKYECPFGSFSLKIKAAFGCGVLTRKMYNVLDLCRKIRNAFAHNDNPDDAKESSDYKKCKPKLMNLDADYAADCIARFRTLRDRCKDAIASVPEFSEVSAVMLAACDNLGSTAFFAGPAKSHNLRFPCAFFGPRDLPVPGSMSPEQ